MFAAADLVDLLVHELARLCAGRLAGALGLAGFLDCFLLRHGHSPSRRLVFLATSYLKDNRSRGPKFPLSSDIECLRSSRTPGASWNISRGLLVERTCGSKQAAGSGAEVV